MTATASGAGLAAPKPAPELTDKDLTLPQSGAVKMVVSGGLKGDVNEDGAVTITDAVSVVNIILQQ